MDIKGQIVIIRHVSGEHHYDLSSRIALLGYHVRNIAIDRTDHENSDATTIKILYVDHMLSTAQFNELRRCHGIVHIVVTSSELISRQPELFDTAADLCIWPCDMDELQIRLERSEAILGRYREPPVVGQLAMQQNLIGQSDSFMQTMELLQRYAGIDAPVLIHGETGTGKELMARALHYGSQRKSMPFQALNCGALPDYLVENELFGHSKGAYTDAKLQQDGLVSLADGGTLFLDEIDSLSLKAQASLLRFLQDGSFRALGAPAQQYANVRVVSASNQNLSALVAQKKFRADLLYRLNTLPINMPALRQRREDIVLLANYFLSKCDTEFQQGRKVLHPALCEQLLAHGWPGNVRELENYIQRAYLLSDQPVIVLGPGQQHPVSVASVELSEKKPFTIFATAKKAAIDQFEASYLCDLLRHTRGNVSKAARIAGKERRVFGRLLKKHNIDREGFAGY